MRKRTTFHVHLARCVVSLRPRTGGEVFRASHEGSCAHVLGYSWRTDSLYSVLLISAGGDTLFRSTVLRDISIVAVMVRGIVWVVFIRITKVDEALTVASRVQRRLGRPSII